jgi:hypothetical protein
VIRNKQYKKINKQYTKQYLMTNQTVPKDATHCYERMSARITKSELRLRSCDGFKLID